MRCTRGRPGWKAPRSHKAPRCPVARAHEDEPWKNRFPTKGDLRYTMRGTPPEESSPPRRRGKTRPARWDIGQPTQRLLRSGVPGGTPSGEGTTKDVPPLMMTERCHEMWQNESPEHTDSGGPPKRVTGLRRGVPRGGISQNRHCARYHQMNTFFMHVWQHWISIA